MIKNLNVLSTLLVGALVLASVGVTPRAQHQTWPQFRGPGALPAADHPGLPSSWSTTKNVEWVADIAGVGWSSPIVWEGKVFVTTATSDKPMKQPSLGVDFSNDYVAELMKEGKSQQEILDLVMARDGEMPGEVNLEYHLICLDLETGRILWKKQYHEGPPAVGRHRKNSYTSETPVTDGNAVYVYAGFLGLFAFDFDGNLLWKTPLKPYKVYLDFGTGASPALHGDKIFILSDNEEFSFLAAFDKTNGKELWRTPREGLSQQRRSAWATPFVWENELRTEVVTHGPGWVISYDLEGKELWRMALKSFSAIQSPFAWEGVLYVTSGAGGPNKPLVAIRPGASGDISPAEGSPAEGSPAEGTPAEGQNTKVNSGEASAGSEHVAWYSRTGGGTYLPTPVIYGGGIYVVTDKGIFTRLDAKTGEQTYKTRIHETARNFTSSPWAYNGMVFCVNEEGNTYVIKAGEEFELLGINPLEEFVMATPAIVGDRLLLRTQSKLYSIRQ